jgi:cytochrome c peroxidase
MKNQTIRWIFLSLSIAVFAVACKRESTTTSEEFNSPVLPATAFNYAQEFQGQLIIPGQSSVKINNNVATLGRVLFYDKFISLNNAVACASCHRQENAFADPNQLSIGFAGGLGTRNAPPIFNLSSSGGFFWDSREAFLYNMVMKPIQHNVEMGIESFDALETKLSKVPYYPALFKKAFGTEQIKREDIALALSEFLLTLRSQNTQFDNLGESGLTAQERRGSQVFNNLHCQSCHGAPVATYYNTSMFNIGLDAKYSDDGRGAITKNSWENGTFKVPSLRNLAVTAPYMHDGRYKTLEEVVEHYNSGVINHPNLANQLRFVSPNGWGNNNVQEPKLNKYGMPTLELTDENKKDLVAFLLALKDQKLLTDVKYSNPFKN